MNPRARKALATMLAKDAARLAASRVLWWAALALAALGLASLASLLVRYDPLLYHALVMVVGSALPAFVVFPFPAGFFRAFLRGVDDHGSMEAWLFYPGGEAEGLLARAASDAAMLASFRRPPRRILGRPLSVCLAASLALCAGSLALSYAGGGGLSLGYASDFWAKRDLLEASRPSVPTAAEQPNLAVRTETGSSEPAPAEGPITVRAAPRSEYPVSPSAMRRARSGDRFEVESDAAEAAGNGAKAGSGDAGHSEARSGDGGTSETGNATDQPSGTGDSPGSGGPGEGKRDVGDGAKAGSGSQSGGGDGGSQDTVTRSGSGYGTGPAGESLRDSPLPKYRAAFANRYAERTGTELGAGDSLSSRGLEEAIRGYYGAAEVAPVVEAAEPLDFARVRASWEAAFAAAGGGP